MSSLRSLALLCVIVVVLLPTSEAQRLCGRRLTETISYICNNKFHIPTEDQLNTRFNHRDGLATRCCRNRCPYEDLHKYCAN